MPEQEMRIPFKFGKRLVDLDRCLFGADQRIYIPHDNAPNEYLPRAVQPKARQVLGLMKIKEWLGEKPYEARFLWIFRERAPSGSILADLYIQHPGKMDLSYAAHWMSMFGGYRFKDNLGMWMPYINMDPYFEATYRLAGALYGRDAQAHKDHPTRKEGNPEGTDWQGKPYLVYKIL